MAGHQVTDAQPRAMPAGQDIRLGRQAQEERMAATGQGRMQKQFAVARARR